jgi:hypothetical protein
MGKGFCSFCRMLCAASRPTSAGQRWVKSVTFVGKKGQGAPRATKIGGFHLGGNFLGDFLPLVGRVSPARLFVEGLDIWVLQKMLSAIVGRHSRLFVVNQGGESKFSNRWMGAFFWRQTAFQVRRAIAKS